MAVCRHNSLENDKSIAPIEIPVRLTRRRPKAVPPVELVAIKPKARLAATAGSLLVWPKLRMPPVDWSPVVAPNLASKVAEPYHPGRVLLNPRPPEPEDCTGEAKSKGLPSAQVKLLIVTGLAVLIEDADWNGRESKIWV